MLKVTPVMQYLRRHHVKVDRSSIKRLENVQTDGFAESMKLTEQGTSLGNLVKHIVNYGKARASHKLYISAGGMREEREQEVKFAKIAGQNGAKDVFVPQRIIQTITYVDGNDRLVKQRWERVISSHLKFKWYDKKEKYPVYEALEPIKYFEKRVD